MRAHPHFNPFNIYGDLERPDWSAVFPKEQPFAVEIGFSNGRWLLPFAKAHPGYNCVGLEVRKPFVDKVKDTITKEKLSNVHVLLANANTAMSELFPASSIELVAIFFPDPWWKPRHLKRRVVQPEFMDVLQEKMKHGALLHIASDKLELMQDIRAIINAHTGFTNCFGHQDWAPENIPGFVTDIENYHLKHQHPIYRLQYRKK